MKSVTGKWWLLWAALVGVFAVVLTPLTPAQVCDQGCVETTAGCVSNTEYRYYWDTVASDTFYDPNSDPDQHADVVKLRYRTDFVECTKCTCTYIDCDYPCEGVHEGGTMVEVGTVSVTTKCVDPAS